MTRMRAPFSSFSLWLSDLSSVKIWEEHSRGRGGCRGTRRREERRSYVAEEWGRRGGREEGGQMMSEDQRSSVSGMEAVSERRARTRSMALFSARRHSFTLRKVWTWAIAGKACTEEERDTERGRQRKHAGRQAMCREKDSYRHCIHLHLYRHAPTRLRRRGKEQTWGTYEQNLYKKYIHYITGGVEKK